MRLLPSSWRRASWLFPAALIAWPACRCQPETAAPPPPPPASRKLRPGATRSPLHSPLDAQDTSGAKQRFVELIRRRLQRQIKDPRREGQWDFWSEGSGRYQLPDGGKAYLMSFRRTAPKSQEGYLVVGTIFEQNTVIHAHWRVPAGIDDIHVMDMLGAGNMIYTVSFDTTLRRRLIYHHLLRFHAGRITPVWSYALSYHVAEKRTYKPASVTFRDEDRDGTREVRLRIPDKKNSPRLWKRRWALFKWSPPQSEFLPLRGLAFHPVSLQKPLWTAVGFLEAIATRERKYAARFVSDLRHCRGAEDLWETMRRRRYKAVSAPRRKGRIRPYIDRKAVIEVDLERPKDAHRYLATLELIREGDGLNGWRLCNIRFFRL